MATKFPVPTNKLKPAPGGRFWLYKGEGIECLGCGESDKQTPPMDPFTRFDKMEHLPDCAAAVYSGGMLRRGV
jgi:hypothetical protein